MTLFIHFLIRTREFLPVLQVLDLLITTLISYSLYKVFLFTYYLDAKRAQRVNFVAYTTCFLGAYEWYEHWMCTVRYTFIISTVVSHEIQHELPANLIVFEKFSLILIRVYINIRNSSNQKPIEWSSRTMSFLFVTLTHKYNIEKVFASTLFLLSNFQVRSI